MMGNGFGTKTDLCMLCQAQRISPDLLPHPVLVDPVFVTPSVIGHFRKQIAVAIPIVNCQSLDRVVQRLNLARIAGGLVNVDKKGLTLIDYVVALLPVDRGPRCDQADMKSQFLKILKEKNLTLLSIASVE